MGQSRAGYFREYRAKRAVRDAAGGLLPFQSAFVAAVCRQDNPPDIAALSIPRGNGKSWLCGGLVARSLTPGDPLFEPDVENILVSASRSQAAIVLDFTRAALGESDAYRWSKDGVIHKDTRTRVRIVSSDARRALGLGANVRLIVADEPGAFGPTEGRRLWDALTTALGKRRTTVVAVGTLAPAPLTGPASWWPSFVLSGNSDGRHVSLLQADPEKWTDFDEVLRVNPVAAINPHLRRTLAREHAAALSSERAARPFRQYRLNIPGEPVDTQPLVTAAEWARVCARPVPACEGHPTIGVDLGGSRSWSAACAVWPSGRVESWALAPGVPSLSEQEREDQVSEGAYRGAGPVGRSDLWTMGGLFQTSGCCCRVSGSGRRSVLVSDPYRSAELYQVVAGRVRIVERARGGGESTSNVQALRARLLDTAAGVTEASRDLLGAAFAQTSLVIDSSGITKVTKARAKRSRDDAAAALLLAAGELARRPAPVELRGAFVSKSGEVTWIS